MLQVGYGSHGSLVVNMQVLMKRFSFLPRLEHCVEHLVFVKSSSLFAIG